MTQINPKAGIIVDVGEGERYKVAFKKMTVYLFFFETELIKVSF